MNTYKEVKNLIHNDMQITKDDIKNIIIDTVKDEVAKIMQDEQFIESIIRSQLKSILNTEYTNPKYKKLFSLNELIYDNVCSEISKMVSDNIKISVGLNKDNLELYEFNDKLF